MTTSNEKREKGRHALIRLLAEMIVEDYHKELEQRCKAGNEEKGVPAKKQWTDREK